jgi:hypothetical protein
MIDNKFDIEIKKFPILSDAQIQEMAIADWYSILESLWTAIGKPVDKKRMQIYGKDLAIVPCELLERAIKRIRLTSIYSQVPTIGEIWQAVKIELAEDNCTTPDEWIERKWIKFMSLARFA